MPGSFEGFPTTLTGIRAMAQGPEGGLWFTASDAEGHAMLGRMATDGVITGEFTIPTGTQPNLPVQSYPIALTLGREGDMWFTDAGRNQEGENLIGKVTPAGRITEYPVPSVSGLWSLNAIAIGGEGDIWFTLGDGIWRISPSGALLGVPSSFEGLVGEEYRSVAAGPDGSIWIAGRFHIIRVTSTGTVSEFSTLETSPESIVQGPGGNMWFTSSTSVDAQIGWITVAGAVTEFPLPERLGYGGLSMAAGPDGNLWVTGGSLDSLWRVTPEGSFTTFAPISSEEDKPGSIVLGGDGEIWFADEVGPEGQPDGKLRIERFVVPLAPVNLEPPAISGPAVQGKSLSVSEGAWSQGPNTVTYQWQSCDSAGNNCSDVNGEVGPSYMLSEGDVNHTLRAVVTASNSGGGTSAASVVSPVIEPLPATSHQPPVHTIVKPRKAVIGVTMTWRFKFSHAYTQVESLIAHGLAPGISITVTCHGRGCAFARRRIALTSREESCPHKQSCRRSSGPRELNLRGLFRSRHLGAGARIAINVAKTGAIGKVFTFTVRADMSPSVEVSCATPGAGRRAC